MNETLQVIPRRWLWRPRTTPIRLLILHATRGETTQELQFQATCNWMQSSYNIGDVDANGNPLWGSAASEVIGHSGQRAVICEDWQQPTWSAGYGNAGTWPADAYGISYELAQSAALEPFTSACIDRMILEAALRCRQYNIEPKRITRLSQVGPVPSGIVGHEDTANGIRLGKCLDGKTSIFAVVKGKPLVCSLDSLLSRKADDVLLPCCNDDGSISWRPVIAKERQLRERYRVCLSDGQEILATPEHRWALLNKRHNWWRDGAHGMAGRFDRSRKLKTTMELKVGDRLPIARRSMQQAVVDADSIYGEEMGYLIGVYLAEGNHISGKKNGYRLSLGPEDHYIRARVSEVVVGSLNECVARYGDDLHLYGPVLRGILEKFVGGTTSHDKHLLDAVWEQPSSFHQGILDGYLDGDGHRFEGCWTLGFCNNSELCRDLRLLSCLSGRRISLKPTLFRYQHGAKPGFRGSIRNSGYKWVEAETCLDWVYVKSTEKIISRSAVVWDVSVGGNGLFALASGLVTHNSDPGSKWPWDYFIQEVRKTMSTIAAIEAKVNVEAMKSALSAKVYAGDMAGLMAVLKWLGIVDSAGKLLKSKI